MQPLIFLQQGDKAMIKRVGGAEETKRFLAGLGFVENAEVSVIFQTEWKPDCKYQGFQSRDQ